MANVSDFRTDLLIEFPDVPIPLIDREVIRAVIEVCEKAYVWKEQLNPQIATTGNQTMHLRTPKGSRIAGIVEAYQDGHRVVSATEKELDTSDSSWRDSDVQSETINYFYLKDRSTAVLSDIPSKRMRFLIVALLKPSLEATEIPDFIREDYADLIISGAKFRLLKMNGKPWSNPNLAGAEKNQFERELKRAKAERLNDFTRSSSLTIRPVGYW